VAVATLRALKYHGGVDVADVETPNVSAVLEGMSILELHCRNLREIYGLTPVGCFNRFPTDTDAEMTAAIDHPQGLESGAVEATHVAEGGRVGLALVEDVGEAVGGGGCGRCEGPAGPAVDDGSFFVAWTASGDAEAPAADPASRARYIYDLDRSLE